MAENTPFTFFLQFRQKVYPSGMYEFFIQSENWICLCLDSNPGPTVGRTIVPYSTITKNFIDFHWFSFLFSFHHSFILSIDTFYFPFLQLCISSATVITRLNFLKWWSCLQNKTTTTYFPSSTFPSGRAFRSSASLGLWLTWGLAYLCRWSL